jgi:hypothetical protein
MHLNASRVRERENQGVSRVGGRFFTLKANLLLMTSLINSLLYFFVPFARRDLPTTLYLLKV